MANVQFMHLVRNRFNDRGFPADEARRRSAENVGLGLGAIAAAAAVMGLVALVFDQSVDRRSPFILGMAFSMIAGFYGLLLGFRGGYGLLTGAAFNVTGEAAPGEAKHRAGFAVVFLAAFFGALAAAVSLALG